MKSFLKIISTISTLGILFIFLLPLSVGAQGGVPPGGYILLEPLSEPYNVAVTDGGSIADYVNEFVRMIVAGATVLAVVVIVYGGFLYATARDDAGQVTDGVNHIKDAIYGLLLLLSAYIILYTVNPQLVDLKLNLGQLGQGAGGDGGGGGVTPGGGAQQFNCPTCAPIQLPTSPNACTPPRQNCTVTATPELIEKLNRLDAELNQENLEWRITEGGPPTRTHQNTCHYNGMCVDANITRAPGQATLGANEIGRFINAGDRAGLRPEYEVATQSRANALLAANPGLTGRVRVVAGITGEHFSVYNR